MKKNKLDKIISINESKKKKDLKKIKQLARAAGELFDQIVICLKDHKIWSLNDRYRSGE